MYDGKKIIPGLIVFLGIVTFPLWHNAVSGKTDFIPKPKAPADKKECVLPKEMIRVDHKALLEDWRESVVRTGERTYINPAKKKYLMSLNRTCMDCHRDKTEFCDQCHNYMGVSPKCWDCHIYPKQLESQQAAKDGSNGNR